MKNICDYLHYNPNTGVFTWVLKPSRRISAGSIAGSPHRRSGYRKIKFDGQDYRANRLAWFFVHGAWPCACLDHRNGRKDDDRIDNLREASSAQNAMNRRAVVNSSSAHKGVTYHKQMRKWQAQIKVAGKNKYLGLFASESAAALAYNNAAAVAHEQFARLNEVRAS